MGDRRAFWFGWRRAERTAFLACCRAHTRDDLDITYGVLEEVYARLSPPQRMWIAMWERWRFHLAARNRRRSGKV